MRNGKGCPLFLSRTAFWFDHFVCAGMAQVQLSPGKYTIEIERGPEYVRIGVPLLAQR